MSCAEKIAQIMHLREARVMLSDKQECQAVIEQLTSELHELYTDAEILTARVPFNLLKALNSRFSKTKLFLTDLEAEY